MKKLVSTLTAILGISTLAAQDVVVKGPDEKLQYLCKTRRSLVIL